MVCKNFLIKSRFLWLRIVIINYVNRLCRLVQLINRKTTSGLCLRLPKSAKNSK